MTIHLDLNDIYNQLCGMNTEELISVYLKFKPWESPLLMPDEWKGWNRFWNEKVEGFWVRFDGRKQESVFYTIDEFQEMLEDFAKGKPICVGTSIYRDVKTITIEFLEFKTDNRTQKRRAKQ